MNNAYDWYSQLIKPSWAPPNWLFGPVWLVLYSIIAISFGAVFYGAYKGKLPRAVFWPFILNLVFNFAFTPLQFVLRNNLFAAIDIFLVLATLTWAMASIWPRMRWVVYANIPYLLWVIIATILQFSITYMNK